MGSDQPRTVCIAFDVLSSTRHTHGSVSITCVASTHRAIIADEIGAHTTAAAITYLVMGATDPIIAVAACRGIRPCTGSIAITGVFGAIVAIVAIITDSINAIAVEIAGLVVRARIAIVTAIGIGGVCPCAGSITITGVRCADIIIVTIIRDARAIAVDITGLVVGTRIAVITRTRGNRVGAGSITTAIIGGAYISIIAGVGSGGASTTAITNIIVGTAFTVITSRVRVGVAFGAARGAVATAG